MEQNGLREQMAAERAIVGIVSGRGARVAVVVAMAGGRFRIRVLVGSATPRVILNGLPCLTAVDTLDHRSSPPIRVEMAHAKHQRLS